MSQTKRLLNKCRLKCWGNKYCKISSIFLLLYIFMQFALAKWLTSKHGTKVNLDYVVVHLDLKGAPPTLAYLDSLLPMLRSYGVNAILMEYEDMFPYEGRILNLSARYCYGKQELQNFVTGAHNMGIEIIPLVQTFGHMEYALKLPEFIHLREDIESATSICPSKSASTELIQDMLEQVITFHNNIKPLTHIHVGCDEVYSLNKCKDCRTRKLKNINLFLSHVEEVTRIVKTFNPTIKVLIWDDMLRWKNNLSLPSDLWNIEPVYWSYGNREISNVNLYIYHKYFRNIWIASAFKGADSSVGVLPDMNERFLNNYNWLAFISKYKFGGETEVHKFKGIILTGWSRYSHMDPLCELLPVSLPSLILNLMLIRTLREGINNDDIHYMDPCQFFNKYLRMEFDSVYKLESDSCSINKTILYKKINLNFNLTPYPNILQDLSLCRFYTKLRILNRSHMNRKLTICKKALINLDTAKKFIETYMSPYYEKNIINEYVTEKIFSIQTQITETYIILQNYSKLRSWGTRPYNLE